jgi:hypothetical protein
MDSWNSFMQSKQARTVLYAACVFFTFYYAIDAVHEMLSPDTSAALIETIGQPTFYIMEIGRAVVCLIAGISFARILWKTHNEPDE